MYTALPFSKQGVIRAISVSPFINHTPPLYGLIVSPIGMLLMQKHGPHYVLFLQVHFEIFHYTFRNHETVLYIHQFLLTQIVLYTLHTTLKFFLSDAFRRFAHSLRLLQTQHLNHHKIY